MAIGIADIETTRPAESIFKLSQSAGALLPELGTKRTGDLKDRHREKHLHLSQIHLSATLSVDARRGRPRHNSLAVLVDCFQL